ncbi:MAG: formamidopyrimidine-DNA glycosylase, partial [Ilumatobacteraceae bacterium]|nr:formamidopyrimidine-DNA glycosylase [Ilumatobacteraceae bacterium]
RLEVPDPSVVRNVDVATLQRAIRGSVIGSACRHGKCLLIPVGTSWMLLRFGMTGSLILDETDNLSRRFERLSIGTDRGWLRLVDRRRLGNVSLARTEPECAELIGALGPDALRIGNPEFIAQLRSSRGSIKSAMMDQQRIAGIGNFGSDEILWRARIRPDAPAASLSPAQWTSLHRATRSVMHLTARAGHTPRGRTWLTSVREDSRALCPRCSTCLCRSEVNGRTSVWCPECQPPSSLATRA